MSKKRVLSVYPYNIAPDRTVTVTPSDFPPAKGNAEALLFFLMDRVPSSTLKALCSKAGLSYQKLWDLRTRQLKKDREPTFKYARVHEDVIEALKKHAPHLVEGV